MIFAYEDQPPAFQAPAAQPKPEPAAEPVLEAADAKDDEDEDGWQTDEEDEDEDGIPPTDCLFCSHSSSEIEENLAHMSVKHGFFIPDAEYCTDVEGLLTYLGKPFFRHYPHVQR